VRRASPGADVAGQTLRGCRRPGLSSPPLPSRNARSARWPARTGSRGPGSTRCWPATSLYHIGIGRPHAGTRVLLLVQDLHIRVINAGTGELLRELILNPDKTYQATGRRSGWPKKNTANHA